MEPTKIIFLDIDGVLNSQRNALAYGRMPNPNVFEDATPYGEVATATKGPESELDIISIKMIKRLCDLTGAQIVLHSMWRKKVDSIEFGKRHGLPIIGHTDRRDEKGYGIWQWLWDHPHVSHFAIIDDEPIFRNLYNPGACMFSKWDSNSQSVVVLNPEGLERTRALWNKMKDAHIQTDMLDGLTFTDFVNVFLQLDDVDLEELAATSDRIDELERLDWAIWLNKDNRSEEQRKLDREELKRLDSTMTLGRRAVAVILQRSKVEQSKKETTVAKTQQDDEYDF